MLLLSVKSVFKFPIQILSKLHTFNLRLFRALHKERYPNLVESLVEISRFVNSFCFSHGWSVVSHIFTQYLEIFQRCAFYSIHVRLAQDYWIKDYSLFRDTLEEDFITKIQTVISYQAGYFSQRGVRKTQGVVPAACFQDIFRTFTRLCHLQTV